MFVPTMMISAPSGGQSAYTARRSSRSRGKKRSVEEAELEGARKSSKKLRGSRKSKKEEPNQADKKGFSYASTEEDTVMKAAAASLPVEPPAVEETTLKRRSPRSTAVPAKKPPSPPVTSPQVTAQVKASINRKPLPQGNQVAGSWQGRSSVRGEEPVTTQSRHCVLGIGSQRRISTTGPPVEPVVEAFIGVMEESPAPEFSSTETEEAEISYNEEEFYEWEESDDMIEESVGESDARPGNTHRRGNRFTITRMGVARVVLVSLLCAALFDVGTIPTKASFDAHYVRIRGNWMKEAKQWLTLPRSKVDDETEKKNAQDDDKAPLVDQVTPEEDQDGDARPRNAWMSFSWSKKDLESTEVKVAKAKASGSSSDEARHEQKKTRNLFWWIKAGSNKDQSDNREQQGAQAAVDTPVTEEKRWLTWMKTTRGNTSTKTATKEIVQQVPVGETKHAFSFMTKRRGTAQPVPVQEKKRAFSWITPKNRRYATSTTLSNKEKKSKHLENLATGFLIRLQMAILKYRVSLMMARAIGGSVYTAFILQSIWAVVHWLLFLGTVYFVARMLCRFIFWLVRGLFRRLYDCFAS